MLGRESKSANHVESLRVPEGGAETRGCLNRGEAMVSDLKGLNSLREFHFLTMSLPSLAYTFHPGASISLHHTFLPISKTTKLHRDSLYNL